MRLQSLIASAILLAGASASSGPAGAAAIPAGVAVAPDAPIASAQWGYGPRYGYGYYGPRRYWGPPRYGYYGPRYWGGPPVVCNFRPTPWGPRRVCFRRY